MELEAHVKAGELEIWTVKGRGVTPNGRALYMLPDVYADVSKRPWPAVKSGESIARTKERRAAMRLVLERFVLGWHLNLERDIAELGSKIHRPQHQGWWEFRSQGPDVQTRLFGFFARKGAFVAVAFRSRENLNFSVEHLECRKLWTNLAGNRPVLDAPYPVISPSDLDKYLTRDDDA